MCLSFDQNIETLSASRLSQGLLKTAVTAGTRTFSKRDLRIMVAAGPRERAVLVDFSRQCSREGVNECSLPDESLSDFVRV
jgi:hypothetical protein